jgi:AcrR family transcriptional regulator
MDSQNARGEKATAKMPRRKRGRERVAGLLAAATEIFAEKGYEGATMTEIAARAGAAIGSLYQFFPTKYALAEAAHSDQIEELLKRLNTMPEGIDPGPAANLAEAILQETETFLMEYPAFMALADRRDIDKKRKAENRRKLRESVSGILALSDPPMTPERLETIALVILQMMRSVIAVANDPDLPRRDRILAEYREMLRHHLESVAG